MRELEVLDSGHLKLEWEERKAFFAEELEEQVRSSVKQMLEQALEAERTDRLAVGRYVRDAETRRDYRNGYYRRDLGTRLGLLCGLRVPRTRRGYRSELLPRYQRRQEAVHALIREAFLRGISTRQVGPVLEPVLGEAYSAQTISRIARGLDGAVEQFHRRCLRDNYLYVFLDGVVLKVRDVGGKVRRRVVLAAYGITTTGQRELLAYRLAQEESEAAWTAFLQDLYLRGLAGSLLRLIITDGSPGWPRRSGWSIPQARVQRCWAQSRPSPTRLSSLGGALAKASAGGGGLCGAGPGGVVEFFRYAGSTLEESAYHQRDRTRLPGSPPPHSAHLQLHQSGQLRAHHFRCDGTPESLLREETPQGIYTTCLTLPGLGTYCDTAGKVIL